MKRLAIRITCRGLEPRLDGIEKIWPEVRIATHREGPIQRDGDVRHWIRDEPEDYHKNMIVERIMQMHLVAAVKKTNK